jgi:hypothetical protein
MDDFLNDTLDLVQGLVTPECDCSVNYFYGTCAHVNKTMLLVDETDDEASYEFFESSPRCVIIDARKVYADRVIKKMPLQKVLESMRIPLVNAMQNGKAVVVRMGDVAADFLTTNDEHCPDLDPLYASYPPYEKLAYIPSVWLYRGGALLKDSAQWPRRMYRRPELDRGRITPVCHANFGVLFTTTMESKDLPDRLFCGAVGLPPGAFEVVSLQEMLQEQAELDR